MYRSQFRPATLLLCTAILAPALLSAGQLTPTEDGGAAPPLDLADMRRSRHRLEDDRGKVVLVNFWASWCGPCVTELPGMQRLQRRMDEAGRPFTILAVNVDEPRHRVLKFIKMLRLGLTVLLDPDGNTAKKWDVRVYPTSYLIDKTGHVRYRILGPLVWDGEEAGDVIDGLLEEESGNAVPAPKSALGGVNPATAPG